MPDIKSLTFTYTDGSTKTVVLIPDEAVEETDTPADPAAASVAPEAAPEAAPVA